MSRLSGEKKEVSPSDMASLKLRLSGVVRKFKHNSEKANLLNQKKMFYVDVLSGALTLKVIRSPGNLFGMRSGGIQSFRKSFHELRLKAFSSTCDALRSCDKTYFIFLPVFLALLQTQHNNIFALSLLVYDSSWINRFSSLLTFKTLQLKDRREIKAGRASWKQPEKAKWNWIYSYSIFCFWVICFFVLMHFPERLIWVHYIVSRTPEKSAT